MLDAEKPEIIFSDEHQKMMVIGEKTVLVHWNRYTNCFEAQVFHKVQNKYGEFVSEYLTSVTGSSEEKVIQEATKL